MEIKRAGSQPSTKGSPEWFTGTVRVDPLFQAPDPAHVSGASKIPPKYARKNRAIHFALDVFHVAGIYRASQDLNLRLPELDDRIRDNLYSQVFQTLTERSDVNSPQFS